MAQFTLTKSQNYQLLNDDNGTMLDPAGSWLLQNLSDISAIEFMISDSVPAPTSRGFVLINKEKKFLGQFSGTNWYYRIIGSQQLVYMHAEIFTGSVSDPGGTAPLDPSLVGQLDLFHSDIGVSFMQLGIDYMSMDLGTQVINKGGFTSVLKDGRNSIIFPSDGIFSIDASATAYVLADSAAGAWRHHVITLSVYRNGSQVSVIDTAEMRLDDKGSTGHLQLSGLVDVQAGDYLRIDAGTNGLRIDYKDRFLTIAQMSTATILRANETPDVSTERTGKDADNIFTVITHKRADNTVYSVSTLSGGTAPEYSTRTVVYYKDDSTTIDRTIVYALTYVAGDLVSEVIV